MLRTRQVGAQPFGLGEFICGARTGKHRVAKRLRKGGGPWGRAGSGVMRGAAAVPSARHLWVSHPSPALCHHPLGPAGGSLALDEERAVAQD